MVIYFVIGLAVTWLAACVALLVFARTLIYPFQPGFTVAIPPVPGMRAVTLAADDGTPLTVWLAAPQDGRPVVLYFMGNAGTLPLNASLFRELAGRGFGIAALNYRGAGGTPGKPSQAMLTADALALYDALDRLSGRPIAPTRRVLFGTSLGAALAVQLATRREAAALVLETPFNRLCELAQIHYPLFPTCLLMPYERWESAGLIGQVAAPVLILHGDADEIIPLPQGQALFTAAREPKRMIVYPGASHNDLRQHGMGIDAIEFIERLGGG